MKSIFKIFGVALFAALVFTACSKDDDPTDNDFFVGTYNGDISYAGSGDEVGPTNGSVTVVKVASGTTYSFKFSNDIPDINNVQFEQKGDHILVNVGGEEGVNYIRLNANKLDMVYLRDGNTWTADCTR